MQVLINSIALLSGLVSLTVVSGGAYLYFNKDAIIDNVQESAVKYATELIIEELPSMISSAMPEIPKVPTETGEVIPQAPKVTGGAIPF